MVNLIISHVLILLSLQFFFQLLQQYFVCDYAVNVDCLSAEGYYNLNDNFGAVQAEERIDDSGFEERIDDSGFEDFEENAEEIEDFENVEESEVPILRK